MKLKKIILTLFKKKRNNMIILPALFLLIAIAAMSYLYWLLQNLESQQASITGSKQTGEVIQAPGDQKSNWKWYENKEYNLEFKYPGHIFVTEFSSGHDDYFWSNKPGAKGPMGLGENGLWMNLQISSKNHLRLNDYRRIIALKPGQTIEDLAITRLPYGTNANGVESAEYYEGGRKGLQSEEAYSYVAVWIKEDRYYLLNLSSFSEETLKKNQYVFDVLLASFRFLEKEDSPLPTQAANWETYSFSGYSVTVKVPPDLKLVEKPSEFNSITRVIELSDNDSVLTINVERGAFGREGGNLEFSTEPFMNDNRRVVIGRSLIEKTKIVDKDSGSVSFEMLISYPDHRNYSVMAFYQFKNGKLNEQTEKLFDAVVSTIRFL